jgi:hypothetical protein
MRYVIASAADFGWWRHRGVSTLHLAGLSHMSAAAILAPVLTSGIRFRAGSSHLTIRIVNRRFRFSKQPHRTSRTAQLAWHLMAPGWSLANSDHDGGATGAALSENPTSAHQSTIDRRYTVSLWQSRQPHPKPRIAHTKPPGSTYQRTSGNS